MKSVNVLRPLIFRDIMKAKFGMKTSAVMLLKPLLNKRQEYSYLFEGDAQFGVASAFD